MGQEPVQPHEALISNPSTVSLVTRGISTLRRQQQEAQKFKSHGYTEFVGSLGHVRTCLKRAMQWDKIRTKMCSSKCILLNEVSS